MIWFRSLRTKEMYSVAAITEGLNSSAILLKLWEKIVEARLRDEVQISEQQYGFMPGRSTSDAVFAIRTFAGKV